MKKTISVDESHVVRTGSVAALNISINGQNGVDTLAFTVPEGMEDWAWRVEIAQNGETGYVLLGSDLAWTVQAGELREGEAALQLVGSAQVDGETLVWKSRQFFARVLPAINAVEAMEPGEASEFDKIAAEVKGDADRADAAAIRAEDAAAGAENIVNTAISDIEAEGQKQAAAVASSGTQALEAIGQVEQTAIAQVQAAGTAQVGAVEDAGDGKLAEIDAANAHVPQINETTGKWQVWDAQTGAYVDTDTDAQGPQGETGATGPQGPAGADGIGLPVATAEDAGKVPVVGADGSYTLGEPVPEVDTTLTEAGAPADAAATGEAIEKLRKMIIAPAGRFGVSGVGLSAPELTRLWDAQGMTATPGTDTVAGASDFDDYAPFNRKKCVGSWALVDGHAKFTVNAYYGDPDYTEDGTNGNYVAIDVTPFYYFEAGGILGVSTQQYPGWSIHPVCLDYDNNIREHTYLPCYQVSLVNGVPVSLPGHYPENGSYAQLMTKLRAYSSDLAGHVMLEPSAVNHYEWLLYTIEFATQNCQGIMSGASSLRHVEDLITAIGSANQIIMTQNIAQNFVVGQTIGITSNIWENPTASAAYCQITALQRCDEDGTLNDSGSYYLITYNGEDRSSAISIGTTKCASRPWICGATQGYAPDVPAVIGHTGSPISNTGGKYPCVYRYRENIFGNQNLTCMDLFDVLVDDGDETYHLDWYFLEDPRLWAPYATANPTLADLQNSEKGFRKLTVQTPASSYVNGYISAEAADPNLSYVHVPVDTTGGSSATYTCDYAYLVGTAVVRSVRRGGSPYPGSCVGLRCVIADIAPSSGFWYFGGALYFIQ